MKKNIVKAIFSKRWQVTGYYFTLRGQMYDRFPTEYERLSHSFKEQEWTQDCRVEIYASQFEHQTAQGLYRLLWSDCDDEYYEKYYDVLEEAKKDFDFIASLTLEKDIRDSFQILGLKHW